MNEVFTTDNDWTLEMHTCAKKKGNNIRKYCSDSHNNIFNFCFYFKVFIYFFNYNIWSVWMALSLLTVIPPHTRHFRYKLKNLWSQCQPNILPKFASAVSPVCTLIQKHTSDRITVLQLNNINAKNTHSTNNNDRVDFRNWFRWV